MKYLKQGTVLASGAACVGGLGLFDGEVFGDGDEAVELRVELLDARQQVGVTLSYDPAYRRLSYPGGDVPVATGVCTDVVIRALPPAANATSDELARDLEYALAKAEKKR